ncbi:MAG TPA: helix-turn-helix domain-containing protein [Roseiflexaceae bacterium]|nr:helix-turn-helix domain-containing protein [Roseiflexaceae bacterium]
MFVRVDEFAKMLGVTDQTVRKWLRDGTIEGKQIGRRRFIPIETVAVTLGTTVEKVREELVDAEDETRDEDRPALRLVAA